MSERPDDRLKTVLAAAARQVHSSPDLADVDKRRRRRIGRKRMQAALVGLALGATGLIVAMMALGPLQGEIVPGGVAPSEGPPGGEFLLENGSGSAVYAIGDKAIQPLGDNVVPFDLSTDGSRVLAGIRKHEPSGLGYVDQLFSIDLGTGARSLILQLTSPATLEAAEWSPDGSELAYTYGPDRFKNASLLAQDQVDEEILCVMNLARSATVCFPDLGTVYSFDWSPDGSKLLIGQPGGGKPLQVVDIATGTASPLVSASDPSVVAALEAAGLGSDVAAVQFREPSWSASGNYVGTIVSTLPMVFTIDGKLVATGHPTLGANDFSWSPTDDVMAYAIGPTGIYPSPGAPALYTLDPTTGEDRLVLSTEGQSSPQIEDVVWSPGGRYLAAGNPNMIRIVDTTGASSVQTVDPYEGAGGALLEWEA